MRYTSLARQRQYFGLGLFVVVAFLIYWNFFSTGIPVIWGPSASAKDIAAGQELFEHQWSANDPLAHGDGLGPVFNARSCAACHFQGGLGGGGEVKHNAMAFEILPRPNDPTFVTGTIHNFSVNPNHKESLASLKKLYPVIKGQTIRALNPHCAPSSTTIPDFDPIHTESVQATALFGAGWVDLISDKAIDYNRRKRMTGGTFRELSGNFDAIPVGRVRSVSGGVGKFGWKNQFANLSDFVAAACANELGLGTPDAEQARPLNDPNYTAEADLDSKQFKQLVAFVKTLPKPVEVIPDNPSEREAAAHGKSIFKSVGCAVCHVPDMGGVEGVYSDFLLYTLDDPMPKAGGGGGGGGSYDVAPPPQLQLPPRPDEEPKQSEWKTPPLWGVADSAPYFHDGSARTLQDAINKHRGDAIKVLDAYRALNSSDQAAVISFLKTLKAPPTALPLKDPSVTKLAKK